MKLPYQNYIDYLLIAFGPDEAKKRLGRDNFFLPKIDDIISELPKRFPEFTYEKNKKIILLSSKLYEFFASSNKDTKWLKKNKLQDNSFKLFKRVVEDTNLRWIICALLIKNIHQQEIKTLIRVKYQFDLDDGFFRLFNKYIFNVFSFEKEDWVTYLKLCSPEESEVILSAMNNDEVRLKHDFGLKTKLKYTDILNDIMLTSYYKFKDLTRDRNIDLNNSKDAKGWAQITFEAGDRKEKFSQGDFEDFGEQVQMEFTFENTNFPTFAEINRESS